MKRLLIATICLGGLFAQEPAKQTPPAATANAAPASAPQPAATAAPTEQIFTGLIDLGYQWQTGVGGSVDAYRSIVNLGSGPKLLNADFTINDPSHKLFDTLRLQASDWGDQPYETFHLDVRKAGLYEFNADYRDFAYFNSLPSFADPLLGRGLILDEQAVDQRRHMGNYELVLFPGSSITPYVSYERESVSGTGVQTFVADQNAFPVPDRSSDLTNVFRAGVRIKHRRYHLTLETGGTLYREDEDLYQNGGTNQGNSTTPYLGNKIYLNTLEAATGVRGSSIFEKGLLAASPADWIDITGQFLFSQPQTSTNYQEASAGQFVDQTNLLLYTSQAFLLSASAKLPHTTGGATVEIRPHRRVRIIESWLTDRMHDTGGAAGPLYAALVNNYNQQEIDAVIDMGGHLTLRGGYRYVWGDASDLILPVSGLVGAEMGRLRRNVGIGAVTYRRSPKLSLTAEVEAAASDGVYFSTSLYNYQRARLQARYQLSSSLTANVDLSILQNQNPLSGIRSNFLSAQESASVVWMPSGGKRFDLLASYSRTDMHSNIDYLEPENLLPQVSRYRDNEHTGTGLFDMKMGAAKLSAGGSFVLVSGSRPTSYFQPLAKLMIPMHKSTSLFAEWRYYGYGESLYLYEGFRTHIVTAGVRFSR